MRIIALLALCIAAVTAVPANPQRIVGGSVTTIDQYPTMSSLLYSWDFITYWQVCGGTIINNRSILTAAHCIEDGPANRFRFRVGSTWANSGGVVHNIPSYIIHSNYIMGYFDNDIAIVRSASTIVYNNNVRPAPIAGSQYNLADNQVVWAAGWGRISEDGPASEQLRHVQIWSVNQDICRTRYAEIGHTVTDNMLCAGWLDVGGRDQCLGDSGSPVYHNGVVVGVCSWSYGCATKRFPHVNVRVSRYTAWIQSNA